jgi:PTS system mannose-specific IID component
VEARVTAPLRARLFLRSLLLQAGFSDERRQGLGFAWAIDPALAAAHGADAAGLTAARARNLDSFNVSPFAVGLPLGAAAALELRAPGEPALADRAAALKGALGAALSGPSDAFFWGALRPLAAALAALVAALGVRSSFRAPFALGAGLGLAAFNVPALWARWAGVDRGLSGGAAAAAAAARLPVRPWIAAARRAAPAAILAAAWTTLCLPSGAGVPRLLGASAFAAGALLGRLPGGPLRLAAAAGLLGAAASAAGWTQ